MPQPHAQPSFIPTGHNNKGKHSFKNSPNKPRYEKKDKPKSGKKDKASGEKKYVTKQKDTKEVTEVKTEEEELPKWGLESPKTSFQVLILSWKFGI